MVGFGNFSTVSAAAAEQDDGNLAADEEDQPLNAASVKP